ncbi:MAG: AraC family transcriptional regulator, partial [Treponema sp.]|nr:AraC family transcriptional regulator [Treponema sp.]
PLDKERKLLNALRRGETVVAKQLVDEIFAILVLTNPNDFGHIRYRATEIAVLLSRMVIGVGLTVKTILENDSRYLQSIQETKNTEELIAVLYRIIDDLAGQIHSFQGMHHAVAFKKAENYIQENFARKISLSEIAKVSGFSAPYFSTIFKEETGENLSSYLNRVRVEKAAKLLTDTEFPLSHIAQSCGFDDQSWFSKIFKIYTGNSPGKFRSQGGRLMSKLPEIGFSDDLSEK